MKISHWQRRRTKDVGLHSFSSFACVTKSRKMKEEKCTQVPKYCILFSPFRQKAILAF